MRGLEVSAAADRELYLQETLTSRKESRDDNEVSIQHVLQAGRRAWVRLENLGRR